MIKHVLLTVFIFGAIVLSSCRDVESQAKAIADLNVVECEVVGFAGQSSRQHKRFRQLRRTATEKELLLLLEHDSTAVVVYSAFAPPPPPPPPPPPSSSNHTYNLSLSGFCPQQTLAPQNRRFRRACVDNLLGVEVILIKSRGQFLLVWKSKSSGRHKTEVQRNVVGSRNSVRHILNEKWFPSQL